VSDIDQELLVQHRLRCRISVGGLVELKNKFPSRTGLRELECVCYTSVLFVRTHFASSLSTADIHSGGVIALADLLRPLMQLRILRLNEVQLNPFFMDMLSTVLQRLVSLREAR
jgi:hypothetical protein